MVQYNNFDKAMEVRNHFKNKASLKSMMIGILLFVFASSCDYQHVKDFYVVNAYEEPIAISYETFRSEKKSLEIDIKDTVLIYPHVYVFGTVGVDNDGKFAIVNMTLHNNDKSIPITQNEWRYEKIGKYHAEYYLIIDTALLQ